MCHRPQWRGSQVALRISLEITPQTRRAAILHTYHDVLRPHVICSSPRAFTHTVGVYPPSIQDVEAAAAASKRLRNRGERERDAEIAKQAAALEDVAEGDEFSTWAKKEDALTRHQWQPIR